MDQPVNGPRFGAVVTAMVTPFDAAGALDLDAAARLARWLVSHGSHGLVLAGTTGEGPVLSDGERLDLFAAVAEAVTVPVLAGTGTNDTAHTVELTRRAASTGVGGVLVVTPYYSRPSQAGLAAHFRAAAEASALPVMLYDIPARTGRRIARSTLLELARDVPGIVAVKDATGDLAGAAATVAHAPAGFEVYCGDDAQTLPFLAVGAVRVVSVASHWAGPRVAAMVSAFAEGDVAGARLMNAELLESYEFESSEDAPNPLPAKAACRVLGHAVGQCRPPMGAAPDGLDGRAHLVLSRLGVPVPAAQQVA